jgi:hypothetical protein
MLFDHTFFVIFRSHRLRDLVERISNGTSIGFQLEPLVDEILSLRELASSHADN